MLDDDILEFFRNVAGVAVPVSEIGHEYRRRNMAFDQLIHAAITGKSRTE